MRPENTGRLSVLRLLRAAAFCRAPAEDVAKQVDRLTKMQSGKMEKDLMKWCALVPGGAPAPVSRSNSTTAEPPGPIPGSTSGWQSSSSSLPRRNYKAPAAAWCAASRSAPSVLRSYSWHSPP